RLCFLAADDVTDDVVDYDGLEVHGPADEKLGHVDGFIVDAEAGRVYYVVVDSGGWFTSRRFLLPIGHAAVGADRDALHVAVSKDALSKYPEFDEDRFRQFSDEDLRAFEQRMASACCPDEAAEEAGVQPWSYTSRRHYDQPAWWKAGGHLRER